jgi:rare lipoprotein A
MSTKGDGMSRQHGARHRTSDEQVAPGRRWPARRGIVVAAGVAIVVVILILAGVTAVSLHLGSDAEPTTTGAAAADADRDDSERAARDNMRDTASVSPSVAAPSSASSVPTPGRKPSQSSKTSSATGGAGTGTCGVSFYATGATTANGERFDPDGLTAAHKTLPFNTRIRVTNPSNGKSVVVRVNDRGPFVSGRCIDLARGAFTQIASLSAGVITARYEVLK